MNILDDEENGIENTLIDPFKVNVSNEDYAFPVGDFIPSMREEQPVEEKPHIPVYIPELPEQKPVMEDQEKEIIDEITDTPEQPAPAPEEGEEEVRISLEEDIDDTTLDQLDSLVDVRDQLVEIGGISKDDVYQVESYYPGLITQTKPIGLFSQTHTLSGYDVSMEAIGSKIIDGIKAVLKWISDRLRSLFNLMMGVKKTTSKQGITLNDVQDKYKRALEMAKQADVKGRRDSFRKGKGDQDYVKKASTNSHYVQLYADHLLKTRMGETPMSNRLIQDGTISKEVASQVSTLHTLLNYTLSAAGRIKEGKSHAEIKIDDIAKLREDFNSMRESHRAKAKLIKYIFENAVSVNDASVVGFAAKKELAKKLSETQKAVDAIESSIKSAKDVSKEKNEAIRLLKSAIAVATVRIEILEYLLRCQTSYNGVLNSIMDECLLKARTL